MEFKRVEDYSKYKVVTNGMTGAYLIDNEKIIGDDYCSHQASINYAYFVSNNPCYDGSAHRIFTVGSLLTHGYNPELDVKGYIEGLGFKVTSIVPGTGCCNYYAKIKE